MAKDLHKEDWEKDAPILSSLKGTKPEMDVPEGYFEGFSSRLMERIEAEASPAQPPVSRRNLWYAVAASFVILLGLGIFRLALESENPVSPDADALAQLDELSDAELIQVIRYEDFSEEEIIEVMGDEALSAMSEGQDLSGDHIVDYLDDYEISEEDLDQIDWDDPELLESFEL